MESNYPHREPCLLLDTFPSGCNHLEPNGPRTNSPSHAASCIHPGSHLGIETASLARLYLEFYLPVWALFALETGGAVGMLLGPVGYFEVSALQASLRRMLRCISQSGAGDWCYTSWSQFILCERLETFLLSCSRMGSGMKSFNWRCKPSNTAGSAPCRRIHRIIHRIGRNANTEQNEGFLKSRRSIRNIITIWTPVLQGSILSF